MNLKISNILPVNEDEIAFIQSKYKICYVHTIHAKKMIVDDTLENLEKHLNPVRFMRTNRQTILHKPAALGYKPIEARKLEVLTSVTPTLPITIPKAKVSKFKKWLKNIGTTSKEI